MMWGYGLGGVWMILFWIGIALLIVWAVQSGRTGRSTRSNRALEVLEERYARGEIDREEFLDRRGDLEA